MDAWIRLGRQSGGVSEIRPVSPRTSRLKPRIGFISPAPTSRTTRSEPVASLSRVRAANRNSISPRVIAPSVVLARSLGDGAHTSPNNSHIRLPPKAQGTDSQKLYPLARPAL